MLNMFPLGALFHSSSTCVRYSLIHSIQAVQPDIPLVAVTLFVPRHVFLLLLACRVHCGNLSLDHPKAFIES